MNKMVWRKKLARLKRQARNAIRTRMRQVVNFALADEPDIYEADEVEVESSYNAETVTTSSGHQIAVSVKEAKKRLLTKDNIKKVAKYALVAFIFFKFGRRAGAKAANIVANNLFDRLVRIVEHHGVAFFRDRDTNLEYAVMLKSALT